MGTVKRKGPPRLAEDRLSDSMLPSQSQSQLKSISVRCVGSIDVGLRNEPMS